jgi:hypothetical protein
MKLSSILVFTFKKTSFYFGLKMLDMIIALAQMFICKLFLKNEMKNLIIYQSFFGFLFFPIDLQHQFVLEIQGCAQYQIGPSKGCVLQINFIIFAVCVSVCLSLCPIFHLYILTFLLLFENWSCFV